MMRSSVDLPEPERPSMPAISPSRSDRFTSSSTSSSPCVFLKPRHTSLTRRISSPMRGGAGGVWTGGAVTAALEYCIALDSRVWLSIQPELGFGIRIHRTPQQPVEQRHEQGHHGDARDDLRIVAG